MIGNPDKFSVIIDVTKEWNIDDSFYNGIMIFSIKGVIFPREVLSATLVTEVPTLRKNLANIGIDKKIFSLPKVEAFESIYMITYPTERELLNDYRFSITPYCFADADYYVFAVSNGNRVRILASKLSYNIEESIHELHNIDIIETYIDIVELNSLITEIEIEKIFKK